MGTDLPGLRGRTGLRELVPAVIQQTLVAHLGARGGLVLSTGDREVTVGAAGPGNM